MVSPPANFVAKYAERTVPFSLRVSSAGGFIQQQNDRFLRDVAREMAMRCFWPPDNQPPLKRRTKNQRQNCTTSSHGVESIKHPEI
jgi:hypothetical protein